MIQIQSLKPFPGDELRRMTDGVGRIVTVENHTVIGGLGGAVAEELSALGCHAPLIRIGVRDEFRSPAPPRR